MKNKCMPWLSRDALQCDNWLKLAKVSILPVSVDFICVVHWGVRRVTFISKHANERHYRWWKSLFYILLYGIQAKAYTELPVGEQGW